MKSLLQQLKEFWFILVLLAGIIMWYANTNNRLNILEASQANQETINQQIIDLRTRVEVISTNVEFIKDKVK